MKKLLIILALVMVLGISGCKTASPEPSPTLEETQQTLDDLENIECLVGLNGALSCHIVETEETASNGLLSVNASDDLDKTKLPSYMLDVNGDYVTTDSIGEQFKLKYFDSETQHVYDEYHKLRGETMLKFVFEDVDLDANEVFAKIVLLINELEYYEYYFLSSTHVVIEVAWIDTNGYGHKVIVESSSDNLLSDAIVITPQAIFDGDMELYYLLNDVSIDESIINQLYYDYTTNDTYIGFILDYK